ncbi:MAG: hypothetical protein RIR70_637 [Pseudomonadota bacterium]|jgi:TPR repeat protein
MRTTKWILLLLIGWSASAASGPVEDAVAAYKQGDTDKLVDLLVDKDAPDLAGVSRIQLAAQQGKAEAQGLLGIFYLAGYGVPKDSKKYFFWNRKAAENGSAPAQHSLGLSYTNGDKDYGIEKDYQKAYQWNLKAADQGYAPAQDSVGLMHRAGWGVPQDYKKALFWYRKAADQGYASGQSSLGLMYREGWGVPKNDQEAYFWYRKAAGQGDKYAQSSLGSLLNDLGNYQEAYFWTLLARANGIYYGHVSDVVLASLEQKLTPAQRAAAQAQARDWKPTPTTRP